MSTWVAVAVGIIPSIGVGLIFWFAIRAVIRADRNERTALARLEEADGGDDAPAADAPDVAEGAPSEGDGATGGDRPAS